MSKRPWPDNAHPTAEQLLEWCRTGMTADVAPYLRQLIDDAVAMHDARMRGRVLLADLVTVVLDPPSTLRHAGVTYVAIPESALTAVLENAAHPETVQEPPC